jgi:acetyl esterase
LLPDTRRLARAIAARGAIAEPRYYPRELHAFHALLWRRTARQMWADQFEFLERHVADAPTLARRRAV